jgi:D-3-phosphoglycerate dehydrogenase / 2-oxoglutarate reductase
VGYGRLGRIVARYLLSFEACVLAADPNVSPDQVERGVRLVTLPELLSACDIVTLHANLTAGNVHLFGKNQFASMPCGSWFINTARGELVDEAALLDALRTGWLAGAAVDVLSGEQAPGRLKNSLITYARRHTNLIVTPHVGGCTVESMEKTEVYLAKAVAEWLSQCGGTPARATAGRD